MPFLTALCVLLCGAGFAAAQPVADAGAPAERRAVVLKDGAGAPLVNIQTPDGRGLSHNRYTRFDVDGRGVTLNNSRGSNPFLAKGAARLILNEVRSNVPSSIEGMISVAGQKADVVVANPSGISVNGGGFKNVGRGVLTTGVPVFEDGSFKGLEVNRGKVTVGERGLDGRGADYSGILAAAAEVRGEIRARQLAVHAGTGRWDEGAGGGFVPSGALNGGIIDTAHLGGMYADSIYLVAGRGGVGVRNRGTLEAGRLVVTSDGMIENGGTVRTGADSSDPAPYLELDAAGVLRLDGGRIEGRGPAVLSGEYVQMKNAHIARSGPAGSGAVSVYAEREVQGDQGSIIANEGGGIGISAQRVYLPATRLQAAGGISVEAPRNIYAGGGGAVTAGGDIVLSAPEIHMGGKPLKAGGDIVLYGGTALDNSPLDARGSIRIEAPASGFGAVGSRLSAGGDITAAVSGAFAPTSGSAVEAGGDIFIRAGSVEVGDVAAVSGRNVAFGADNGITVKAPVYARGGLELEAGGDIEAEETKAAGDLRLTSRSGGITLSKQRQGADQTVAARAGGNIEMAALQGGIAAHNLDAAAGGGHVSVLAGGDVSLEGRTVLEGRGGVYLGSVGEGRLKAGDTAVSAAAGDVGLYAGGTLDFGGSIKAAGAVSSVSGGSQNVNGSTEGGAVYLRSSGGSLHSGGSVRAVAGGPLQGRLEELDGSIRTESAGDTVAAAGTHWQADKDIGAYAGGTLLFAGEGGTQGNPSARTGTLEAGGGVTLTGGGVRLEGTQVNAGGDVKVAAARGDVRISAVRSTFDGYVPEERAAGLRADLQRVAQESASLQDQQAAWERTPEFRSLEDGIVDLLEQHMIDPGYTAPVDLVEAVERNGIQPPGWEEVKARTWPYRSRINGLAAQKTALEQTLAVIQTLGRGHEYKGSVIRGANIGVAAAGGADLEGALLDTSGKAEILAAGRLPESGVGVNLGALFDTFEYGSKDSGRYAYALFTKPAEIRAGGGIDIAAADGGVNLASTRLDTAGRAGITAAGGITLPSGQGELYTYDRHSYKTGKWYRRKYATETREQGSAKADPAAISAAQGISLKAGGGIDAYASVFDAPEGSINLTAGHALRLFAVDETSYDKLESRQRSKFLGIGYNRSESQNSSLMQGALPARLVAEGASLDSGWDTLLEGTQFKTSLSGAAIRAGVGEEAKADAKILFKGIVSRTETQQAGRNRSALWQKTRGSGTVAESLRLPAFDGPAPEFGAPGGYIADIPEGRLKDEIEKLAAQPGHEYLKQLQAAQNTDWNKVRLAYDNWDYAQSGLTGGGAALITVIVTALTYGAASGAAAGAGTAGGTAATTTTTAAGATVAGTTVTTGGIAAGAGTAALAALNSKAAISLINNRGDLGKTLKELGRSDTVKTLVSAAVTAGIAEKLGAAADWNGYNSGWHNRLTANLATAGSTALANTAIHGGSLSDGLEKAVLNALVQSGHTEASLKIKGIDNRYIAHKIAHAVAGCAAAAANKGKCQDGAIGAAVGEMVGGAMLGGRSRQEIGDAEYQRILGTSKVIAGSVAALSGGDVDTAANAAQVAVVNNALAASPDEAKYQAELDALWADSKGDSNRYYQGVQKIAERDGLALDILLSWVPSAPAAKAGMGYAARTAMMERRTGIANIFNSSTGSMKLGGTELKEIAQAANRSNTTRVFDASKIGDAKLRKEVFDYAEKLGGGQKLTAVPNNSGRWYIKTADGATINVRSVSSNALPDGSKPRWTIEIVNDKKLNSLIQDKMSARTANREIKFK